MSHQDYVEQSDPGLVKEGFSESEIHRVTRRFGNIAHWGRQALVVASNTWDQEWADNPILGEFCLEGNRDNRFPVSKLRGRFEAVLA